MGLYSGIPPGRTQEIIQDARDQTWVGSMPMCLCANALCALFTITPVHENGFYFYKLGLILCLLKNEAKLCSICEQSWLD